jgi:hypothetical protein
MYRQVGGGVVIVMVWVSLTTPPQFSAVTVMVYGSVTAQV